MKRARVVLCILTVVLILTIGDSAGPRGSTSVEYSRQQFLARLVQVGSGGVSAAEESIARLEASAGWEGQYSYCEYVSALAYGAGYTVDAGVLYLLQTKGQSRSVIGIAGKWTGAPKGSDYEWTEAYHVVDWTPDKIVQMVRGRVAVSLRMRGLRRPMLRARLLRSGFQEGIILGGMWHSAKVSSWREVYLVEDIR